MFVYNPHAKHIPNFVIPQPDMSDVCELGKESIETSRPESKEEEEAKEQKSEKERRESSDTTETSTRSHASRTRTNSSGAENDSDSTEPDESDSEDMYRGKISSLDGYTMQQLTSALNEEEAERKRGIEWTLTYKKAVLQNPTLDEMKWLCNELPKLPMRHLQIVLRIIAEDTSRPELTQVNEIELAIDKLEDFTFYKLQCFVKDPRGFYASKELVLIERRVIKLKSKMKEMKHSNGKAEANRPKFRRPRGSRTFVGGNEPSSTITRSPTIAECRQYFDIPVTSASRLLGVGPMELLRIIRAHGHGLWPTRKPRESLVITEKEADVTLGALKFILPYEISEQLKEHLKSRDETRDVYEIMRKFVEEVRRYARNRRKELHKVHQQRARYRGVRLQGKLEKKAYNQRYDAYKGGLEQGLYGIISAVISFRHSKLVSFDSDNNDGNRFAPSSNIRTLLVESTSDAFIFRHLCSEMNAHIRTLTPKMSIHKAKIRTRIDALLWLVRACGLAIWNADVKEKNRLSDVQ